MSMSDNREYTVQEPQPAPLQSILILLGFALMGRWDVDVDPHRLCELLFATAKQKDIDQGCRYTICETYTAP
jgi:hypothetical protein